MDQPSLLEPWRMESLLSAPEVTPDPSRDRGRVRAIFYEGLPYQGRPTRVFAYVGLPELAPGERAPAMVLVHGGGGTAFHEWVSLWNRRGYAAIAMDNCGGLPDGDAGPWPRHEHSGPAGWGGFDQIDQPIVDQWTFHAVADVILARQLISACPEVDPDRVGLTGVSWGGFLTSIVSSVDPGFAFAAPVYGCGYIRQSPAWAENFARLGTEAAERWDRLWDPARYLSQQACPTLWVTGTNDFAYTLPMLQASYRLPRGERTLCVTLRMPHGHGGPGENPAEIHAFADAFCRGGDPLARVLSVEHAGREAMARFESARPIERAELLFTADANDNWVDRHWVQAPATIRGDAAHASIPADATAWQINLIDDRGLTVSTEHIEPKFS